MQIVNRHTDQDDREDWLPNGRRSSSWLLRQNIPSGRMDFTLDTCVSDTFVSLPSCPSVAVFVHLVCIPFFSHISLKILIHQFQIHGPSLRQEAVNHGSKNANATSNIKSGRFSCSCLNGREDLRSYSSSCFAKSCAGPVSQSCVNGEVSKYSDGVFRERTYCLGRKS